MQWAKEPRCLRLRVSHPILYPISHLASKKARPLPLASDGNRATQLEQRNKKLYKSSNVERRKTRPKQSFGK